MNRSLHALAAVALLLGLAACGGGSKAGCSVFDTTCAAATDGAASSTGTGTVATSPAGTVVLSLSSDTISASSPGTVTALVKDANGRPLSGVLVTFASSNGVASIDVPRVPTNTQGFASTVLQPAPGAKGGDYVTASADIGASVPLTTRVVFTVSPVTTSLSGMAATPTAISAYSASVITVAVQGASAAAPVTVNFSSTCGSSATPKAVLSPSSVTVTGSTASTTYQDKGCGGTDRIIATINGTNANQALDLSVALPVARSLAFLSATPDVICLAGSGCLEQSVVSFQVVDQNGLGVPRVTVLFALDFPAYATLEQTSAPTNDQGIANVNLNARAVPAPVRVRATVNQGGVQLSTVSNVLSINAGLPTSRAVSFSAGAYNVDGLDRDGTASAIRVQLNDRFGNPVSDGTAVSFISEGASVIPASCKTVSGVCSVNFVSSEPRPSDGRVTVVAYAQGEEAFDDTVSSDNRYTVTEPFDDVGVIYIDRDEDGIVDPGEYIVGSSADGVWSSNNFVRASSVFTLSSHATVPRLFKPDGTRWASTPFSVKPGLGNCRQQQLIYVRDGNANADALGGNPIPAGATLSLATTAKSASVSIDASPVRSGTSPTSHVITVDLADCSVALTAEGTLDLIIAMPNSGPRYTIPIGTVNVAP